jgi:hypothetical protein
MSDAESYLCIFCSSDIRPTEQTTTVPNLGILVHTRCYEREQAAGPKGEDTSAAA